MHGQHHLLGLLRLARVEGGHRREEANVAGVRIQLEIRTAPCLQTRPIALVHRHLDQRLVRPEVLGIGFDGLGVRFLRAGSIIRGNLGVAHGRPCGREFGIFANRLGVLRYRLLMVRLFLAHLAQAALVGFLRGLRRLQGHCTDHVAEQALDPMQHDRADIVVLHDAIHSELQVIGAIAGQFCPQRARAEIEAAHANLAHADGSVGTAAHHRTLGYPCA